MQLLIVGRVGELRVSLPAYLAESGCHVRVAGTPEEVVRALRETAYEIVLVETVGGTNAERVRAQIRGLQPSCRVIFVAPGDGAAPGASPGSGAGRLTVASSDFASLLRSASHAAAQASTGDRKVRSLIQAMDVVVSLLESEDPYFAGFAHRVAELCDEVARQMTLPEETCEDLAIACLLRDLGKVGLSRSLLEEPGVFAEGDAERMRAHVAWSARLLAHVEFPDTLRAIIRHHHERYDGSGYPDGLSGRQIPVGARIIAAAETFVAMISDRPHRPARSVEEARAELMRCVGTQLDPEVVEVLFWAIAQHHLEGGSGGRPAVLIVDPDASFRRLVRLRFQDEGIDSVMRNSADGVEALLESRPPEMLIVGVDALGAAPMQHLRSVASRLGLSMPVVALVDTEARDSRVAWLKRGADDVIAKDADLEEIVLRVKAVLHRTSRNRAEDAPPEGITGRLEAMALPDVCQFLMLGVKTARVQLRADDGREATIWFQDGAITHAACGDHVGEEAFFDALHFTSGHFVVNHGVFAETRTIDEDSTLLLMEGARRLDESRRAASGVMDDALL